LLRSVFRPVGGRRTDDGDRASGYSPGNAEGLPGVLDAGGTRTPAVCRCQSRCGRRRQKWRGNTECSALQKFCVWNKASSSRWCHRPGRCRSRSGLLNHFFNGSVAKVNIHTPAGLVPRGRARPPGRTVPRGIRQAAATAKPPATRNWRRDTSVRNRVIIGSSLLSDMHERCQ